jgi:hypothetical protein
MGCGFSSRWIPSVPRRSRSRGLTGLARNDDELAGSGEDEAHRCQAGRWSRRFRSACVEQERPAGFGRTGIFEVGRAFLPDSVPGGPGGCGSASGGEPDLRGRIGRIRTRVGPESPADVRPFLAAVITPFPVLLIPRILYAVQDCQSGPESRSASRHLTSRTRLTTDH